jgi:hypothetical protein
MLSRRYKAVAHSAKMQFRYAFINVKDVDALSAVLEMICVFTTELKTVAAIAEQISAVVELSRRVVEYTHLGYSVNMIIEKKIASYALMHLNFVSIR